MLKVRLSILIFFFVPLCFCSLFRPKIQPYPRGVIFPLEEAFRINYEGKIVSPILRDNGLLYLATGRSIFYCIENAEKKISWRFQASDSFLIPPFIGEEKIYLVDNANLLYCLDKKGNLLWSQKIEEKATGPVIEKGGLLYSSTEKGLLALSSSGGRKIWLFPTDGVIKTAPLFFKKSIIVCCTKGKIYFVDNQGSLRQALEVGGGIHVFPLLDHNLLYLGTDGHFFYCFDLENKVLRWKVKVGGQILSPPVSDEENVFFIASNNVLYCLNKKSGEIRWWKAIPAKGMYPLEIVEGKILVSSLSPLLLSFDGKTGKETGRYEATREIKSNPLWFEPYLLINHYDDEKEEGQLLFLKKEVKAFLSSSIPSPQKVGEEIVFSVSAIGFYRPKFEFFIKTQDKAEVVQKESEKSTWTWFPEKEGNYNIGVRVFDEKEMVEVEISFEILK